MDHQISPLSHPENMVEIARWRAENEGDRCAYTFLSDGDQETESVSYRELDREAKKIAAWLQQSVGKGEAVLLLFHQGLDFIRAFYGCLYAGVIAVPAYPPERNKRFRRLQAVASDAQAKLALSNTAVMKQFDLAQGMEHDTLKLPWFAIDQIEDTWVDHWIERSIEPNLVTYLQYSSGSTGNPKGIQVTHQNLIANSEIIRTRLEHTKEDVSVSWLPIFHDLGLIGCVIQPMYVGFHGVSLSPYQYVVEPFLWLKAIHRYRGTTTCSPNFGFDLCVRKTTPEQRAQLDLSCWRVAVNCAEPVRQETLERFTKTFAPYGFRPQVHYPMYGMAETTLFISGGKVSEEPNTLFVEKEQLEQGNIQITGLSENSQSFVSCGPIGEGYELKLVHPHTLEEVEENEIGEIWVKGLSVATGYWKRPEQTAEDFHAYLGKEGPFLRTGDLGFIYQGELYLTGRFKDLIIIRGKNHYPQDIEQTVESVSSKIRPGCGAAFSVERSGQEVLVVVQEVRDHIPDEDLDHIAESISRQVAAEHGVPLYELVLLAENRVTKTSSGKIQRRACKAAYLNEELTGIRYQRNWRHEETNCSRKEEVIRFDQLDQDQLLFLIQQLFVQILPNGRFDPSKSIRVQGCDSIQVLQLKHLLEQQLQIRLSFDLFLSDDSVMNLVEQILLNISSKDGQAIAHVPQLNQNANLYPLSKNQSALWYLHQLHPENRAYHLPIAFQVEDELDEKQWRISIQQLVNRHPALRTVFDEDVEGYPCQRVLASQVANAQVIQINEWTEEMLKASLKEEAWAPFDLQEGPLFRARLFKGSDQAIILFVLHHMISDLWSIDLLINEWELLYSQKYESLTELDYGYADYVFYEQHEKESREREEAKKYWAQELKGDLPILSLPFDYERPKQQSFQGAKIYRSLDQNLHQQIYDFCSRHQVTPYVFFLTLYQVMLSHYAGQDDILVGSPVSGREMVEWADLVGYFVQPMVIRGQIEKQLSFCKLFKQIKSKVDKAFQYRHLSLAEILEQKQIERNEQLSPLFQTMFVFEQSPSLERAVPAMALGVDQVPFTVGGINCKTYSIDEQTSQFDLSFLLADLGKEFALCLQYDTKLFRKQTADRMLESLMVLVELVLRNPEQLIADCTIIPKDEQNRLLQLAGYQNEEDICTTLPQLFEMQVKRTPQHIALRCAGEAYSYQELNRRADQLAYYLLKQGYNADDLIGICCDRSWEMVAGILAVLKLGAAYVPIDPSYPLQRIRYMIDDANIATTLTTSRIEYQQLLPTDSPCIVLDQEWAELKQQPEGQLEPMKDAHRLAYIIYTSGSTGMPKGVAIEHAQAVNLVAWAHQTYTKDELVGVLFSTSICFDLSIFELFVPLSMGGTSILINDGTQLIDSVDREYVTLVDVVPSVAMELLRTEALPKTVKVVNLAGETLSNRLVQKLYQISHIKKIYNLYGPSECTTYSTFALTKKGANCPPSIGRPIRNTQLYIFDEYGNLVPQGVVGELYIGGSGVTRGYLNWEELTAQRYIDHPSYGRLYRTGDLVRWDSNGELQIIGRIDNQVKLRGFRIELGEIEAAVDQFKSVKNAVVIVREQRLLLYLVWDDSAQSLTEDLIQFMSERLPSYMIPDQVIVLETMPLTPSGKINRKALPDPVFVSSDEERKLPQTPVEQRLWEIWSTLLPTKDLSTEVSFFQLGGHSLLAMRLIAAIKKEFQITLSVRDLFQYSTITALATRLTTINKQMNRSIPVRSQREEAPLSYTQQRLWFLDRFMSENREVYNVPAAFQIEGIRLEASLMQRCVDRLIQRHEILRTTFIERDGIGQQIIHQTWQVPIDEVDLQALSDEEKQHAMMQYMQEQIDTPFALEREASIRFSLIRLNEQSSVLFFVGHHMVIDGWSVQLIINELSEYYETLLNDAQIELDHLPIQFADFAVWQRTEAATAARKPAIEYWRKQLANPPSALQLPSDRPRPPVQTYRGGVKKKLCSNDFTNQIKRFCQQENVTLFMTLLTGLQALLYRYTGQNDLCIGSPVAGRENHQELEQLVGSFINPLVFRTKISPASQFRQLLQQVKETALAAYEHQTVPFEQLLEELKITRDLSHTPLFQVMLVLQNTPIVMHQLKDGEVRQLSVYGQTAKYDVTLFVTETDAGLELVLEYNRDLFDVETMDRFLLHFEQIMQIMINQPKQRIDRCSLLLAEERALISQWNRSETIAEMSYSSIHQWIEAQVEKAPMQIAVRDRHHAYTFQQLNERANRLARYLRQLGVCEETFVGICLTRSVEMIVAMLAVLKAGAAYVPLDPQYPAKRITYMTKDAELKVVLTEQSCLQNLPSELTFVCLEDKENWQTLPKGNLDIPTKKEQLSYLIYTSGSTGKPKGVMIEHRNVLALIHWALSTYEKRELAGVLASTSICFDLSIFEIFVTLCGGGMVCIAENALELPDLPYREQITLVNTVPSAASEWVRHQTLSTSIRVINLAGEPLSQTLVDQLYQFDHVEKVFNLYGPSEDTTYSTFALIERSERSSPVIGRPINQTQVHVLDRFLQPVPLGVVGECYLSGEGVARGYWRREDITTERFVTNAEGVRLYRTGDLVRYRNDGQLQFLGRVDFQTKIRGFRIECGEIEEALRRHELVRDAVVITVEDERGKRLAAYMELQMEADRGVTDWRAFLRKLLPEYMIPSHFVELSAFRLTPNGKIDRNQLPKPDQVLQHKKKHSHPRNHIEETLKNIWQEVLQVEQVSIHDHFFELGGDSILILQVIAKAKAEGLKLTPKHFFAAPTIAELAVLAKEHIAVQAEQGLVEGDLSLTPIQTWFFSQQIPNRHNWNQSVWFELDANVTSEQVEQVIQFLVQHHDALRLRFYKEDDSWKAKYTSAEEEELIQLYAGEGEWKTKLNEVQLELEGQLNIEQGPLLKIGLVRFEKLQKQYLVWVIHHLVVDGVSWRVLLEDFATLSEQLLMNQMMKLPEKSSSFKQWSTLLRSDSQQEKIEQERDFWQKQLQTASSQMVENAQFNIDSMTDSIKFSCSEAETSRLITEVPVRFRAKLMEILLAALMRAYHSWSREDHLLVHLEGHGRETLDENVDLSRTVGWFTSIYPLLLGTDGQYEMATILRSIKERYRQIPQNGIGYGMLRYLKQDSLLQELERFPALMSFNYLGRFDLSVAKSSVVKEWIQFLGPSRRQENVRPHLIDVTGIQLGNELKWEFLYSRNTFTSESIKQLGQAFMEGLRWFINQSSPDPTSFNPSDFPQARLNQSELSKVLAKISQRKG
ncbi:non-ribosomal peptide synthase domain TIGR01720/amino acid adenylation domain-containing protein [Seinonella peptonophila]|uniref:Non-ribosomal peptide synthase domain TIGR01720/amino acid adenylation domain-containing protein n=1 Tax=Seinonella peptonophila TaxID=112248 RepID=A0A1M4US44_9BACL|nr:non-ribosomal peptide synthetase [Seinonella peptonophila]SHE59542.1 non-ribosomal peptide synthase domain TIGR01720/amino acid adenylation domain-containing protein [Seinonella peptonophila]